MKVAILSGNGNLPIIAAKQLKVKKIDSIAIVFQDNEVKTALNEHVKKVYVEGIAKIGRILDILKKEKITDVLMIGKFDKTILEGKSLKPDFRAIWMLFKLINRNNDTIHYAIVDLLKKHGINVLSQSDVLNDIVPTVGVFSKAKPNKAMLSDIEFGYTVACELGRLDVGQTVVVKKKCIMAVESSEGTDATIRRGCGLAKSGAIVVKAAKPQQDDRFDLPVVGMDSFKAVIENGGKAIAVEADKTLIVDLKKCLKYADDNGLVFIAFKPHDFYNPKLFE